MLNDSHRFLQNRGEKKKNRKTGTQPPTVFSPLCEPGRMTLQMLRHTLNTNLHIFRLFSQLPGVAQHHASLEEYRSSLKYLMRNPVLHNVFSNPAGKLTEGIPFAHTRNVSQNYSNL